MLSRFRNIACSILALAISSTASLAQNPQHFSPYKTLWTMRHRHSDLVMLAAHRGLHSLLNDNNNETTPENSLQSVQNAANAGLEVVEIDVRLTQDGVPILSHDSTWGRETNVGANWKATLFDPWGLRHYPDLTVQEGDEGMIGGGNVINGPQEDAGVNPSVDSWSNYSVQTSDGGIILRDSHGFHWSSWNEHPPTLQQALDFRRNNHMGIVYAIDIKDANALWRAWKVVATNYDVHGGNDCYSVFFKFDATNFPFANNFKGFMNQFSFVTGNSSDPDSNFISVMPVWQTAHIRPSQNGVYGYGSETNLTDGADTYEGFNGTAGLEFNIKEDEGILQDAVNNFAPSYSGNQLVVANFQLVVEQNVDWGDGRGFYDSAGYCCAESWNWFYNGSPYGQPSDNGDNRGDVGWMVDSENINFITSDDAVDVGNYLALQGKRNISYMKDYNF